MADLVIESEHLKTSWLQQELMQSRDLQHPPIRRQPTVRNLSSAGRGSVRGILLNGQQGISDGSVTMATQMQRSLSAEGECLPFPQIAMKGIYNSSKLQELPPGYFSNGDLWLSGSRGEIVRSKSVNDVTSSPFQDKSRAPVSASMNNMSNVGFSSRIPTGIQTQVRSRSAKQRSLGMPRSDYRPLVASESQILDFNGWRCISPEYYHQQQQNPFLVKMNNYQDNGKKPQRFHYYGQTRINLDDPTGLFHQFDQKNSECSQRRPPASKTNPTENLVLVRTARKHSAMGHRTGSRTLGHSKKGKAPSPPTSPFLPPELFLRLQHHSRSIIDSTDMLQRFKDSMVYQNSHASCVTVNGTHASDSSDERINNGVIENGRNEKAPQKDGCHNQNLYKHQVLDNFSKYSYMKKPPKELKADIAAVDTKEQHTTASAENQDRYDVDETEGLTQSFVTKATTNDRKTKKEQLSFSEFFLVGIENSSSDLHRNNTNNPVRHGGKATANRRSVRFKVQDTVHEYEPWAPIQAPC